MAQVQEKVSVGTWRVYKAASAALVVMPRHRDGVLGVDDVERDLAPAVELFLPAADALRAFSTKAVGTEREHDRRLEQLWQRTQFWLTYVRISTPSYTASDMPGARKGPDVVIDRARGVIKLAQSFTADQAPRYAAPMLAELLPMFDQCVRDHIESNGVKEEEQRLQGEVRRLMVPVYRGVILLRMLLRNALGAAHVDVRALNMEPPSKRRAENETPVSDIEENLSAPAEAPAPTTAQRLALVQR